MTLMLMRWISVILLVVLAGPAWAGRADREKEAAEIWRMDRLLTIRIRMTAEQWQLMQPEKASRLATAMAVPQRPTTQQALDAADGDEANSEVDGPPQEGERRLPGLTGNQYAYIKAAVAINGETMSDVGVRFKGQWSYALAGASPRRPLKLKFDHFVEDQSFHGIQKLSLSSNAVDPSQLRETLGFALFRDAGLPASRTFLAMVYLTVEGLYDNELLGLYTGIEDIEKDFLARHFGTTKGLVIRPERTRNLAYFGERWEEYDRYNIQTAPTPFTAGRFIDFTRLIHLGDEETFCTDIGNYVDPEQFTRFIAANVLMVNLDGVLVNGHNFYIHIHPKTGLLTFIPWDLHYSFGPSNGKTMEEWVALTIDRPYRASNRLLERVLAMGWLRDMYHEHLRELSAGVFAPERMHARIDQLEQVIRQAEAAARAEGKELPGPLQMNPPRERPELKAFVTARVAHVEEQLAGRIEGDPVGGWPNIKPPVTIVTKPAPPPPPKPQVVVTRPPATAPAVASKTVAKTTVPPRPTRPVPPPKPRPIPLNPLASFVLNTIDCGRDSRLSREEVTDAAKHLFMARPALHGGRMDESSLALTLDHLGRILDAFPPASADSPPTEPSIPALTWAKAILQRTGGGQRSLPDLLSAANAMFTEGDVNQDGQLTSQELSTLLDQLVPRQQ